MILSFNYKIINVVYFVGLLNPKEEKRLLKKQYHQLYKRYCQSIKKQKDKCLHFTFPFTYPCRTKSHISRNSSKSSSSQLSTNINQLKSAVSILFTDDKTSLRNISSNAYKQKPICDSILSNGIYSCIIQNLLKLNNTKKEK